MGDLARGHAHLALVRRPLLFVGGNFTGCQIERLDDRVDLPLAGSLDRGLLTTQIAHGPLEQPQGRIDPPAETDDDRQHKMTAIAATTPEIAALFQSGA